jgi:hypothetical protein
MAVQAAHTLTDHLPVLEGRAYVGEKASSEGMHVAHIISCAGAVWCCHIPVRNIDAQFRLQSSDGMLMACTVAD